MTHQELLAEERETLAKHRHMEKMRRAKERTAARRRARESAALWREVQRKVREEGCRCPLRPGMTRGELLLLEEGCRRGSGTSPGYVCRVLDYYRRKVGH